MIFTVLLDIIKAQTSSAYQDVSEVDPKGLTVFMVADLKVLRIVMFGEKKSSETISETWI